MVQFPAMPQERFYRNGTLLNVVDGDTVDVKIDLGWSTWVIERLRLEHVDTPEVRGAEKLAGKWVADWVRAELPVDTEIVLASLVFDRSGRVRGKYGRTVSHIYRRADQWCLNQALLDEKLAWETDDSGSLQTARDLALLTGIPAELR